jgi:hypothetical protein
VQPLVVGVLGRQLGLDLLVLDDAVLVGVDEEHPPGWSRPCGRRGGVEVEHADLGGQHDEPVVGDPVARGAQPLRSRTAPIWAAVGEHDARGPSHGLHQRGVELVERAPLASISAWFSHASGDHHQHRVGQRPPAHVEQLEHLVERRGVRGAGVQIGVEPLEVARDEVA